MSNIIFITVYIIITTILLLLLALPFLHNLKVFFKPLEHVESSLLKLQPRGPQRVFTKPRHLSSPCPFESRRRQLSPSLSLGLRLSANPSPAGSGPAPFHLWRGLLPCLSTSPPPLPSFHSPQRGLLSVYHPLFSNHSLLFSVDFSIPCPVSPFLFDSSVPAQRNTLL